MSTENEKTADAAPLSREQLLQQYYGNKFLHSVGAGAGVGLGATALYQLLRELKKPGKKEKKYSDPPAYGSGSPMIVKEGFDLSQTLGSLLPKHLLPLDLTPGGVHGGPSADPYAWRKAWSTAANIGGAGLGAYGGHKLVEALVKAKKKREMADAVEDARRSYYDALGGHDKAAALDAAYESMKRGSTLLGAGIGAGLGGLVGLASSEKGERLKTTLAGAGAGGLAGAGIGALAPRAEPYVRPYLEKARAAAHKMTAPTGGRRPTVSGRPTPPAPKSVPPTGKPSVRASVNGAPIKADALGGTIPAKAAPNFSGQPSTLPGAPAAAKPAPIAAKPAPIAAKPAPARGVRAPLADPPGWNAPYNPNIIYADSPEGIAFAAKSRAQDAARAAGPASARAAVRAPGNTIYLPDMPSSLSELKVAPKTAKTAGILSTMYNTPQTLRTAYLLSILGAGGLGAHYMYNRTKELTQGENLAKARASRARLRGLPPVWVDPDSLAQVKQLAENDE